jgi:formiminoglutamate deiminase
MTTYWAPHASLKSGHVVNVRITVEGDRISDIAPRQRPRDEDVRLSGIVVPGFANAHSHAFHRALRGRTHGSTGNFWSWRDTMYAAARNLTPDRYLALARAVFGEMVVAGYTVVGEFHYLHHGAGGVPYDDPNAMGEAIAHAARDAGIRLTLLDTCYVAGGLDGGGHGELDEVQQRFSDGDVGSWAERHAALSEVDLGASVRVGAAAHSVRGVPETALKELASATEGEVLHAHVSEQLAENSAALAFYGRTPTQLLADAGLLRPGFCAVHATHLSSEDIRLLAQSGSGVCFCPTTERDLADGIGPARRLAWSGVPLSIGSDQHAVIDPFEEVRGLEMHERLMSNERGRFRLEELQQIGSAQGYDALGWPEGGRLQVGALADFVVVDLESVRTVGCRPEQVLMAAGAPDVTDVFVGGTRVVAERRHVLLGDIAPSLADALELIRVSA